MKIPNIFVPEKGLEKKTEQLVGYGMKKEINVKAYYHLFLNQKKNFTIENLQNYFKRLSYENALKIVEYEKEQKYRFLEGLADIP